VSSIDRHEAAQILQWSGGALILVFLVNVLFAAYPIALARPEWQLLLSNQLRGGASFALVGALLMLISLQLDHDTHIEADGDLPEDAMRARHPWRFLDHSCSPNARIAGRILVAIAPITAGSHITFDYTTTEASMSTPFDCHCGAAACLGTVRGFLHLTPEQQRARGPWLAPHLRDALSR